MSTPIPERLHEPKPGRRAFICDHKDHEVPIRVFRPREDDSAPHCPKHGKMRVQKNAPYMGQPIPEAVDG